MAGAGITQSICLPLLSVYQLSTNGMVQVSVTGLPGGLDWPDCISVGKRMPAPPLAPVAAFSGFYTAPPHADLQQEKLTQLVGADLSLELRIHVSRLVLFPRHCWPQTLSGPAGCQM